MRQPVSHIRTIGRVTQGVKLVKLDDGTKISSISRVINDDNPEEVVVAPEEEKQPEQADDQTD
jgi:DNA gyrase subunit A